MHFMKVERLAGENWLLLRRISDFQKQGVEWIELKKQMSAEPFIESTRKFFFSLETSVHQSFVVKRGRLGWDLILKWLVSIINNGIYIILGICVFIQKLTESQSLLHQSS